MLFFYTDKISLLFSVLLSAAELTQWNMSNEDREKLYWHLIWAARDR